MSDILTRIAAYKRDEVDAAKSQKPLTEVAAEARDATEVRGFVDALLAKRDDGLIGLIAEVKKASPSKGLIREDFHPADIARAYQQGGAACLSVLTDGPSFQGAGRYLIEARAATSLPALRKDFLLDTYQVAEARALGADCILIIMAMVDDDLAKALYETAQEWGMDALVEVHDGAELERAVKLGSRFIGINNRNLRTFETKIETSLKLASHVPENVHLVCESGIYTPEDIEVVHDGAGISSFLIGESLMRQEDVLLATRTLLGEE